MDGVSGGVRNDIKELMWFTFTRFKIVYQFRLVRTKTTWTSINLGEVYTVGCADYGRLGVGKKNGMKESSSYVNVELPGKAISIGSGSCTSYAILEGWCFKTTNMHIIICYNQSCC